MNEGVRPAYKQPCVSVTTKRDFTNHREIPLFFRRGRCLRVSSAIRFAFAGEAISLPPFAPSIWYKFGGHYTGGRLPPLQNDPSYRALALRNISSLGRLFSKMTSPFSRSVSKFASRRRRAVSLAVPSAPSSNSVSAPTTAEMAFRRKG